MPEIKSRFLEQHRDASPRRRLRTSLLTRFETMLPAAQRAAVVTRLGQRLAGPMLERGLGIVDLPAVPSGTLASRAAARAVPLIGPDDDLSDVTVVVLPDAFTAFLDPGVLEATIYVLRAVGERAAVGPFAPSGKLDHVTGRRKRFARSVARRRDLTERLAGRGADLVVIEPAIALLPGHEYRQIDGGYPVAATVDLASYLAERVGRLPDVPPDRGKVQLFGHCTETSLAPRATADYRALLEAAGFQVTVESTTCCGMAGVFGHEAEHHSMSRDLFDRSWRRRLDDAGVNHRCASGYSCRSQAKRFGFDDLRHPVQLVANALAPER